MCQLVHALINLGGGCCRSGVTDRVRAWDCGYWLNYSSAAQGCWAARRWLSAGWHTEVYADSEAENDLVHIPSSAFCSVPHLAPLVLALIHNLFFFFFLLATLLQHLLHFSAVRYQLMKLHLQPQQHGGVSLWCVFLVESIVWKGAQAKTAHANCQTAAWKPSSHWKGRRWSGGCCRLLCQWIFWFKGTCLSLCDEILLLMCYSPARRSISRGYLVHIILIHCFCWTTYFLFVNERFIKGKLLCPDVTQSVIWWF